MTYEDEVIEAAKEGLMRINATLTPQMEKLLRAVFQCGYKQGKIHQLEEQLGVKE